MRARNGIEIVYQDLALCDNLTAAANVFLGRELTRRVGPLRLLDYRAMYARAGALFAELKSETRPRDLVRRMSGGQRQAVAIARTRLSNPRIVLLDEPTAAISVRQVAEVLDLIRRLRDQGIAVVLISHRMPDVFAVADRVLVLRRGRKVAEKPIAESSPGGGHRADHRSDRCRLKRPLTMQRRRRAAASTRWYSVCCRRQAFWVTVALLVMCGVMSRAAAATRSPAPRTSTTSRATSPSSASWRSA